MSDLNARGEDITFDVQSGSQFGDVMDEDSVMRDIEKLASSGSTGHASFAEPIFPEGASGLPLCEHMTIVLQPKLTLSFGRLWKPR